jgi:hypothetical protein
MGRACSSSTDGERRITCQVLVRKYENYKPLGRFRHMWWDNFKIYLKGIHTDQFWGPSTVHILWVPRLISLGLKWLGHETGYSLPANATPCNIPSWRGQEQLMFFRNFKGIKF